jgi:hypothetical protein
MNSLPDPAALPPPVARYLQRALPRDYRLIRRVHLKQAGTLRASAQSTRWFRFQAEQVTQPLTLAFQWDARVRIAPLFHLRVHDAYSEGKGASAVKLMSVLRVASDAGTPEINAGALQRYLAEAAWYPTALLPSATLRWKCQGNNKALATLTDAGVSVTLEFRFNDADEIESVFTPGRWERVGRGYRLTPWEGRYLDYRTTAGMLVPGGGKVGWYHHGTWQEVWTGTILESTYEFVP